jgi:hypothetical protein
MATMIIGGTASQRKLLKQAVDTFTRKLIPDVVDLDLTIELIRNLYRKEDVKGDMLVEDDDEEIPNEFNIRLDSAMHNQALLRALAHEMVHVKQYVRGEMRDAGHKIVVWKGKKHVSDGYTYWDQPWEIEAYGRETGLLEHFIRYRRYQNKKWYRDLDFHK